MCATCQILNSLTGVSGSEHSPLIYLKEIKKKFFLTLIYLLCVRERECEQRRERERIPSRLRTVSVEPDKGLELTNFEIMS